MAEMEKFGQLSAKYSFCSDFVTIYIEEAHPSERPNFSGNLSIPTHTTLEDRVAACKILEDVKSSSDNYYLLVDLMDNSASKAYAALPERLYVILDGKIIFEGGQGPFDYDLEELETFIETFAVKSLAIKGA